MRDYSKVRHVDIKPQELSVLRTLSVNRGRFLANLGMFAASKYCTLGVGTDWYRREELIPYEMQSGNTLLVFCQPQLEKPDFRFVNIGVGAKRVPDYRIWAWLKQEKEGDFHSCNFSRVTLIGWIGTEAIRYDLKENPHMTHVDFSDLEDIERFAIPL